MEQIKTGKFIAELRKEKGMTQEQLGDRLGVNSRSVSRWEMAPVKMHLLPKGFAYSCTSAASAPLPMNTMRKS